MKKILIAVFLFASASLNAQYFYFDIIGTEQSNALFKKIRQNQLTKMSATSYEGDNKLSTDFVLEQRIDNENLKVMTRSATVNSGESFFISQYNGRNQVVKTVDSSANAINTVQYQYDLKGRLLSTTQNSSDFDGTFINTEVHAYKYNDEGKPVSMIKVKNGIDTTMVTFKLDENGNVIEENWFKKGRNVETYYYYYNTNNRLTDITRFNQRARQMLPDYMFEYDAAGRIAQMTQVQGASANYLVWRYFYNDKGLKEKEFAFNKQKELLGKIEYSYQ